MEALERDAPQLRCELIEAEPEQALPALALGDLDLVLGDEWQHQPLRLPAGLERHELCATRSISRCPAHRSPAATRRVPLAELAGAAWTTGHPGMAWEEMTRRTCREHGGFEPDIRHRTNDATVSLALVARGLAVALVPDLVMPGGIRASRCADRGAPMSRTILAVTRAADAARPSTQALVAAVRDAVAALERAVW